MAFKPEQLITREFILDRNGEIAFCRLSLADPAHDAVMPFMLRLANIEAPESVYLLPADWVQDVVLFKKLARDMLLLTDAGMLAAPVVTAAREAGFRIVARLQAGEARSADSDFVLASLHDGVVPDPDTIYSGVNNLQDFERARASVAMYYCGPYFMQSAPQHAGKSIHPGHALILEIMAALQQEADPRAIETLFKRDVTLTFKLLRYINSPWFGLASRVESVRHALSIIGSQQLLKWLSLLALTAGQGASPALTRSAMVRAKLMELAGARLPEKRDSDHLFLTGMLSLLDRIMGIPLPQILERANLPETVSEALLHGEGRFHRYLLLAQVCEGLLPLPEPTRAQWLDALSEFDLRAINIAHLEAIEWATQVSRTSLQ